MRELIDDWGAREGVGGFSRKEILMGKYNGDKNQL